MKSIKMKKNGLAIALACIMLLGLCLSGCGHTHEWSEWTSVASPLCDAEIEETRSCECGENETRTQPPVGHNFDEWTVTAETDCSTDGAREHKCSVCGEIESEIIASPGHNFSAATLFAPKTCTACGVTEGEALATVLEKGSRAEQEDHAFTLEDIYYTEKISEKHGNITYSFSGSGSYNLVLKLDFQNLATEELDSYSDRFENMELVYMDKYEYEGDYRILGDDIVPLAEGYVYVLFAVPESMENDLESRIVASFELDGETYAVVINEGLSYEGAPAGVQGGPESSESLDLDLSVGDVSVGEEYSIVLKEVVYGEKISEKHGNITYSIGGNGSYYIALKLEFVNLSTETLQEYSSERFEDMELVYNDKYEYEGDLRILGDDIVPLASGNVYVVYTVPEAMESDESGNVVAKFAIDGDAYTVVVNEGDGSSAEGGKPAIDQGSELSVGDVRTGEESSFVLEEIYFTNKITEKHGNVSYSIGGDGYYLVLKLEFTNYGTETVNDYSDYFEDIEAVFDGKYEYEGRYAILADDIVPLSNGYVYVYFDVPEAIESDSAPLVAQFSVDGGDYTVDCRAK